MIEETARATRSAYSDVRDVPALAIKDTIDKTPILNTHIIFHLIGQVRDAIPQPLVLDTLLRMSIEADAKASLAASAFEAASDGTSNEHALGAVAAIGTLNSVATEFVDQIHGAHAAYEEVVELTNALNQALMKYRIAAHDAYRPAEVMIEARRIATQELKAYYTDIMGPNGEIREEWNL